MKTYKEFIKEVNYSVYGQARLGSTPSTATSSSISSGVSNAIKNIGTGKSASTVAQKGKFGLSGSGYVSMSGSSGSTSTPTKTKPPTTKPPTTTKVTPTTSTPTRIRPTLNKGTQTPNRTLTKPPSSGMNPITKRISDYRMSTM